jgi:hypothetical protein
MGIRCQGWQGMGVIAGEPGEKPRLVTRSRETSPRSETISKLRKKSERYPVFQTLYLQGVRCLSEFFRLQYETGWVKTPKDKKNPKKKKTPI